MGVALAVTFVIAIGATTMRYTTVIEEMNLLFNDQIMVTSDKAIVIQAIPIGGGMLPQDLTVERIQSIDGVSKATPVLLVTPISIGEVIQPVPVNFTMGIPAGDWESAIGPTALRRNAGHFPQNESSEEAVVGASLADQLGWTVGTQIHLDQHNITVAGILSTKIALLDRCMLMPLRLTQEIYGYPGSVNLVLVTPASGQDQSTLAEAIQQDENLYYVQALTEKDRNDMVQPVLDQVATWNLGLQTVVFAMSLILVMTVMVMSVSERRRDFATLDAIGAPINYVFRAVLTESVLIGVIGGLIGVVFGSLAALVLASLYTSISITQFFPSIFAIVPPLYMFEALAGIIGVCCLGGIIPALNAARTRITDVLKAEY